jgi:hypothetical protein
MTCPKCGAGIANNVAFCLYCGKQVRGLPKQARKEVPKTVSRGDPPVEAAAGLTGEKTGGIWIPVILSIVGVAFVVLVLAVFSASRRQPPGAAAASAGVIVERMSRRVDVLQNQISRWRADNDTTLDALDEAEREVLKARALIHVLPGLTNAFEIAAKQDSIMLHYREAKDMVRDALGSSEGE